jgi:hypothetical protein
MAKCLDLKVDYGLRLGPDFHVVAMIGSSRPKSGSTKSRNHRREAGIGKFQKDSNNVCHCTSSNMVAKTPTGVLL